MSAPDTINGLRALADHLEAHPELVTEWAEIEFARFVCDATEMAELVKALGGSREKSVIGTYMEVKRDFGGGVSMTINAQRSSVCTAVVVGTETVEVPDPDAPKVTVTRDVIEWECSPVLEAETPP